MAHKKRKIPKLIVRKNAFSRFLEKNYGYTHVRQFTEPQKFSSRLNSIFIAKDAEGRDVFIKACRYGDIKGFKTLTKDDVVRIFEMCL